MPWAERKDLDYRLLKTTSGNASYSFPTLRGNGKLIHMSIQRLMRNALGGIAVLLLAAVPAMTGCKGFFVPVCRETSTCPGSTGIPTASPAAGAYTGAQTVTLTDATSGATICYTTDGTTPAATTPGTCSAGKTYTAAISLSATATIKAIGTLAGSTNSPVLTAAYTIM